MSDMVPAIPSPRSNAEPLLLLAPLSGIIVPLERIPDQVFAQKLAGDGISIDPLSDHVLAPCDALVLQVHRARHAITLEARGLEIIIHVGLDTVALKGDGFTALVREGATVRAGDPLLSFDADLVARRARSLLTQVLISNVDRIASIEASQGAVVAGRDVIMRVMLAVRAEGAPAVSRDGFIESKPIVIAAESGLHARPAALVTAASRRFTSELRLVSNGREANARSLVSIMALEVGAGDVVTVVARGIDAAAAIADISRLLESNLTSEERPSEVTTLHDAPQRSQPLETRVLRGVSASPGVAVGTVYQLRHDDAVIEHRASDPQQEQRLLEAALAAAHAELDALHARLSANANAEDAAIFLAHRELLQDPELLDRAAAAIRDGASAAFAWKGAYTEQVERLTSLKSELLAARAADLRDVGRRVLHHLVGGAAAAVELPAGSIIVAEDLPPSDAASLDRTRVLGFCTTSGSSTSHAAILARGLGIPAVAGIDPRVLDLAPGTRVILDGDRGEMRTSPSEVEVREVSRRREMASGRRDRELKVAAEPATTIDGQRVEVVANIGDVDEALRVVEMGGEGVGLLRTEFLFMHRQDAPDEQSQTESYTAIARALGPARILVIRTLDVGGDKPLSYFPIAAESNPFLGERGIRFTMNRPALFRGQIRAILRASAEGKVAVMFPMVATMAEWRAAKAIVEEERASLGVRAIPMGIMVETPAAAMIADQFAREADFLSIGSNDLTQYTLAMDRTNARLAPQLDAFHPAVLRLISATVSGGHGYGRWVGVCGAMAGDLDAIPVLIGMGVDELSVDVPIVPAVKARVRELSLAQCQTIAREALNAQDGAAVRAIVARYGGATREGNPG